MLFKLLGEEEKLPPAQGDTETSWKQVQLPVKETSELTWMVTED